MSTVFSSSFIVDLATARLPFLDEHPAQANGLTAVMTPLRISAVNVTLLPATSSVPHSIATLSFHLRSRPFEKIAIAG